jgi:hypothetical protein
MFAIPCRPGHLVGARQPYKDRNPAISYPGHSETCGSSPIEAVKNFLISGVLTALMIGVPTVLIWLRSGRRLPLTTCYDRALLHLLRLFGFVSILYSVLFLFLFLALSDLVGTSRAYGSDAAYVVVVAMAALFGVAGCVMWQVASRSLRRHRSLNDPSN